MGAGGVLLDDERAGADAADRELLVPLDLDALDSTSVTRAPVGRAQE